MWVLGWLARAGARVAGADGAPGRHDARLVAPLVPASGPAASASPRVVAGIGGRALLERQRVASGRGGRRDPARRPRPSPALGPAPDLATTVAGLTPHRRCRTTASTGSTPRCSIPSVDTADWTLRIHGLVDRETTLTWDELVGLPMFEQYVTIACVSNEVGGNLVGNAKWTGVRLRDVLEMAGVQAARRSWSAGRSTAGPPGMPTAWVMDPAREPMIAVKMNDEPLPPRPRLPGPAHRPGPVRLRVGDEVARRAGADDARGVRRLLGAARLVEGGADPDPVADRHAAVGAGVAAGRVPDRRDRLGARPRDRQGRGRRSTATWHEARLSQPISDATWVQWVLRLGRDARPTTRSRSARPTATGDVQTERPDAAGARRRPRLATRRPSRST